MLHEVACLAGNVSKCTTNITSAQYRVENMSMKLKQAFVNTFKHPHKGLNANMSAHGHIVQFFI